MDDRRCTGERALPRLFTLDEVAEFLGVARRTVNEWVAAGRLPVSFSTPMEKKLLDMTVSVASSPSE